MGKNEIVKKDTKNKQRILIVHSDEKTQIKRKLLCTVQQDDIMYT